MGHPVGEVMLRITPANQTFVCGVVCTGSRVTRAAPMLAFTYGWTISQVEAYCEKKGWTCEELSR